MTKNPLLNALGAVLYIVIVVCVMFYGVEKTAPGNSIFIPITVVSLFTLSAAVMGYLFLSQPVQLYIDGKKKDAVDLFVKTVAVFAGFTIIVVTLLFSGVLF